MPFLESLLSAFGVLAPVLVLGLFLVVSSLMIWRLEVMADGGFEGTLLGALVMPYCSGFGNLVFVWIVLQRRAEPAEVAINCLVNNVTNLTLLIGLPALVGSVALVEGSLRKGRSSAAVAGRLNRLSVLLSLAAVLFFTGTVNALSHDGVLNRSDGMVLVGMFFFWQSFCIYERLKSRIQARQRFPKHILVDVPILIFCAFWQYHTIDYLVNWLMGMESGFINESHLGWLSGWLMVMPNALLALYYGWRGKGEVVYSSQAGDAHICIPLCIGLFALFRDLTVPSYMGAGLAIIAGATLAHIVLLGLLGRMPRWAAVLLIGAYGWFLYVGLA